MARENYARAQRRNYPRGGARKQFLIDAEEADKQLVLVKEEIAQLNTSARHASIPQNWFYEVEEEPITYGAPAASASSDDRNGEDDDGGRNPLYLKNQNDP
jgi:hypothetical protein